jgi:hypothetical protein
MKFDSTDHIENDWNSYYGAVRAVVDEVGNGNSEETILEFETPAGFAQLMEVTILTGNNPRDGNVYKLEDVHTIRIKITGEWEGGEIKNALAELVSTLNLKVMFEK